MRAQANALAPPNARPTPIVVLDAPSAAAADVIVERLGELCSFYKVGSELFTAAGPDYVRGLRDRGLDVFLDLKFHDIPNTVASAVRAAVALDVRLLTVHASGGATMLAAAVEAAEAAGDGRCGVLAVTVLTSLDAAGVGQAWGRPAVDVEREVVRLATMAADAGAYGIVCSGYEGASVRAQLGDRLALVIPGVRLPGDSADDQTRVVTPQAAAAAGARYVIVGRSVTRAADAAAAMGSIHRALSGQN